MLRITRVDRDGKGVVLKLEGRMVGPWVELLRGVCSAHQRIEATALVLDLNAVEFADRDGVDLLHCLRQEGVGCASWPHFLRELVDYRSRAPRLRLGDK